jgi:hypothetical protein
VRIFLTARGSGDLTVDAGLAVTAGRLVDALTEPRPGGDGSDRSLLVERSGTILAPDRPLAELDLRSGDTVRVVEIRSDTALATGPDRSAEPGAALRMLTGPRAGSTYRLSWGSNSVGRTSSNDVVIIDPGISRRHAIITVDASSVVVTDRGSTNGIVIDGRPIAGPTSVSSGQRLLLGQSWAAVDHFPGPVIPVEGKVVFDRPARMIERHHGRTVRLSAPPDIPPGTRLRPSELLPSQPHQHRELIDAFYATVDAATAELDESLRLERASRLRESPSLDDTIAAVRARTRLWERGLTDPDVLVVRLGLAELPSRSRLEVAPGGSPELRARVDRLPRYFATVDGVPATVDLGRPGGLTLRGPLESTRPLAWSLIGQLVGLNGPDQLGVLVCGDELSPWDWLKWLPHADLTGTGDAPVGDEAIELVDRFLSAPRGDAAPDLQRPPMIVAIVDGRCAGLERLVTEGPDRGVHPLILSTVDRDPTGDGSGAGEPEAPAGAVLTVDGPVGRLALGSGPGVDPIALETCSQQSVTDLARLLAPIVVRPPDPDEGPDDDHLVVGPLRLGGPARSAPDADRPDGEEEPASADGDDHPAVVPAPAAPEDEVGGPGVMVVPLSPAGGDGDGEVGGGIEGCADDGPGPAEQPLPADGAGGLAAVTARLALGDGPEPAPFTLPPTDDGAAADTAAPDEPAAEGPVQPVDLVDLPRPEDDSRLVLGTVHMPNRSAIAVFAFNPGRDGSLGLIGGPGSGKTESLRTVAAAAAMLDLPAEELPQIYTVDLGGGLHALSLLPTVIASTDSDPRRAAHILVEIEQLLADRLLTFELAGADSIEDFRRLRPTITLRRVLVLIDDLARVVASLDEEQPGRTREVVGQLLELGSSLGVHLVFTADRADELAPLLAPKVGRWLEFLPDGTDPGRATVGSTDVRFAVFGAADPARSVEGVFGDLASELVYRGLAPVNRPANAS